MQLNLMFQIVLAKQMTELITKDLKDVEANEVVICVGMSCVVVILYHLHEDLKK